MNTLLQAKEIVEKADGVDAFHKGRILSELNYALELSGVAPSTEQKLSNRFYVPPDTATLNTGDLISLDRLDEELTKAHAGQYQGRFSENFYPYFFKSYQYAVVATQCCKISNNNCHVIELAAIRPMSRISYELLSQKQKDQRSKVLYESDFKVFKEKFRKLCDQQAEQYFYYPAYCEKNITLEPALTACIEIKVPIRVKIDSHRSNINSIKDSRIRSISPIFRSKLSEKLGRFYINVALENTQELFDNEEEFSGWIEGNLADMYPIDKTKTKKEAIAMFIKQSFPAELSIEQIWENKETVNQILDQLK